MTIPLIPDAEPDIILTNAYFTPESYLPAVYWQLNQKNGLISLTEARARAQALFQAVGYAEGEGAIVKGLIKLHTDAAIAEAAKGFGVKAQAQKVVAQLQAQKMAAQLNHFLRQGRAPLMEGVSAIFGSKTQLPLIEVAWYGEQVQWETIQSIDHAIVLIETAEAAESDAYFRWFLMERIGIEAAEAYPLIAEFQTFRQRRQLEELFKGGDRND